MHEMLFYTPAPSISNPITPSDLTRSSRCSPDFITVSAEATVPICMVGLEFSRYSRRRRSGPAHSLEERSLRLELHGRLHRTYRQGSYTSEANSNRNACVDRMPHTEHRPQSSAVANEGVLPGSRADDVVSSLESPCGTVAPGGRLVETVSLGLVFQVYLSRRSPV